jgi:hypothetical protein
MSANAIVKDAIADYFELHYARLERLASKIHAYHDLDAMADASSNKTLAALFSSMADELREEVEEMADFNTREALSDIRSDGILRNEHKPEGDPFFWHVVYAAIMDAAMERAAEME